MAGYYNQPEVTANAFDEDGYFSLAICSESKRTVS